MPSQRCRSLCPSRADPLTVPLSFGTQIRNTVTRDEEDVKREAMVERLKELLGAAGSTAGASDAAAEASTKTEASAQPIVSSI